MATAKTKGGGGDASGKSQKAQARSLDDEIDALFKLPLAEFTAARNALAARLKKAGHAEESRLVKSFPKPSVPAWTINQLYWGKREAFDRLITTGEKFRTAQAAQLAGRSTDIRAPLEARRLALAELSKLAASTLRAGGGNPTPDTMRRITTTLEALATYGALPEAPRGGRLTDDVEPPGFETLAALVPRIGGTGRAAGPSHVLPFQQKARPAKARKQSPEENARREAEERKAAEAAAKAAAQEAERTLRDARKEAQRAEEALKKAAARAKEAEREKAEAEQRFEKASAEADAARQNARQVAAQAEDAAQAVEDAERALDKAERELKRFD